MDHLIQTKDGVQNNKLLLLINLQKIQRGIIFSLKCPFFLLEFQRKCGVHLHRAREHEPPSSWTITTAATGNRAQTMGIKGGTFVITVRSFIKCVSFQHCSPHQASFFQNYSSQPIFSRIKSAAPGRASLAASGRSISMQNISADIENNNHSSGFSNRFSNGTNLGNTNIYLFQISVTNAQSEHLSNQATTSQLHQQQ